jgi:hypothetical protein
LVFGGAATLTGTNTINLSFLNTISSHSNLDPSLSHERPRRHMDSGHLFPASRLYFLPRFKRHFIVAHGPCKQ